MAHATVHRMFSAILALWFSLGVVAQHGFHTCPMHDGPGGAGAGHGSLLAAHGHASEHHHHDSSGHAATGQAGTGDHGAACQCTCLGHCCAAASCAAAIAECHATIPPAVVLDGAAATGMPRNVTFARPPTGAHVLPFPNGPPGRADLA